MLGVDVNVTNLPLNFSEDNINTLVKPVASCLSCSIVKNYKTNRSQAVVHFPTLQDAQQVIDVFDGNLCLSDSSEPVAFRLMSDVDRSSAVSPKIIVMNLPGSTTESDVCELINDYCYVGEVQIQRLPVSRPDVDSGLVNSTVVLKTLEDAENLVSKLNGTSYKGKTISVKIISTNNTNSLRETTGSELRDQSAMGYGQPLHDVSPRQNNLFNMFQYEAPQCQRQSQQVAALASQTGETLCQMAKHLYNVANGLIEYINAFGSELLSNVDPSSPSYRNTMAVAANLFSKIETMEENLGSVIAQTTPGPNRYNIAENSCLSGGERGTISQGYQTQWSDPFYGNKSGYTNENDEGHNYNGGHTLDDTSRADCFSNSTSGSCPNRPDVRSPTEDLGQTTDIDSSQPYHPLPQKSQQVNFSRRFMARKDDSAQQKETNEAQQPQIPARNEQRYGYTQSQWKSPKNSQKSSPQSGGKDVGHGDNGSSNAAQVSGSRSAAGITAGSTETVGKWDGNTFGTTGNRGKGLKEARESNKDNRDQNDSKESYPRSSGQRNNKPRYMTGPVGANLFVLYLSPDVNDATLSAYFSGVSGMLSCHVFVDPETGTSKGYGFVSYASVEQARKAIELFNGIFICGRRILVDVKREEKQMIDGDSE